ncbi:Uncharacterized protein HZ326_15038 [Fusarium oxysporum f. sp. albedinis]|nr:Uncharacterized protein HZ326_15038 [Fusarium oxysporum f. sp. albedinis]
MCCDDVAMTGTVVSMPYLERPDQNGRVAIRASMHIYKAMLGWLSSETGIEGRDNEDKHDNQCVQHLLINASHFQFHSHSTAGSSSFPLSRPSIFHLHFHSPILLYLSSFLLLLP